MSQLRNAKVPEQPEKLPRHIERLLEELRVRSVDAGISGDCLYINLYSYGYRIPIEAIARR